MTVHICHNRSFIYKFSFQNNSKIDWNSCCTVKLLTDKLDEEATIVDQRFLSMNSDFHFNKHLDPVQVADK